MPRTIQDRCLGGLYVQSPDQTKLSFPLKHTEVLAKVAGNLARVEVTQSFENPFTNPLEAVYIFPLPDEAAVDNMEIKIGDKIIKGEIKKREEAKQIYEKAKQQGKTAGLLEQERDNIFTQSLANILPGEQIDVTICYTDSLKFEGGNYEFVFPMVVGPRYIPGTPIDKTGDTDQVPDASRINPTFLPPEFRSCHDIGVTVEIDAGLPISKIHSTSHQLEIEQEGQFVRVKLAGEDTIPNKDLILRYQVSNNQTQTTVLTQTDDRGGHFAVYFIPALQYHLDEIVPKDIVFLMDSSGSQSGDPMLKSKELMRRFIAGLNPHDTFTIINFSSTVHHLSTHPLANTPGNRQKAIDYINQLQACGGTEMLNGIKAVLTVPPVAGRLRSIVLLTDGYIGNENEILSEVQRHLKPGNRVYSFGVGSSVNRFLINRIAEIGRGISRVVRQDEPTEEVAEKFFRQMNNPVLMDIEIEWKGTGNLEIYPSVAPDLFAEQPLVLFGRHLHHTSGQLTVSGITAGGNRYQQIFNLNFEKNGNSAIAQLWGRHRIKDLMNQMVSGEKKSIVEAVTNTALTYQLLSQYTAFVAVSEDVRVNPNDELISMSMPVEMPEGVNYYTTAAGLSRQAVTRSFSAPAAPKFQANEEFGDFEDLEFGSPESFGFGGFECVEMPAMSPPIPHAKKPPISQSPGVSIGGNSIKSALNHVGEKVWELLSLPQNSHLEILNTTGLDDEAIIQLTQHLLTVNLPAGYDGIMVLEIQVQNGRVRQVILEDESSTIEVSEIFIPIKKLLLTWQVPKKVGNTICLTLQINP